MPSHIDTGKQPVVISGGIKMIEGIKAVICDIGGTLYRTERDLGEIHRRFLSEIGLERLTTMSNTELEGVQSRGPDVWMDEYMLKKEADIYWEPSREEWIEYDRRLLKALGAEGEIDGFADEYQKLWDDWLHMDMYVPLAGCEDTLWELHRRGYKLGIASNRFGDPSSFLERDGILSLFKSVEFTNVPGYKKPSPYMLLKVAGDLGVNPRRCVYLGNYVKYDVEAAIRGEMVPVLITECNPEEKDLAPPEAHVIEHLPELLKLLPQL